MERLDLRACDLSFLPLDRRGRDDAILHEENRSGSVQEKPGPPFGETLRDSLCAWIVSHGVSVRPALWRSLFPCHLENSGGPSADCAVQPFGVICLSLH